MGASEMHGYTEPATTKTESGDLIFQYDAQIVRYGMFGHFSGFTEPHTILGKVRITNVVSRASLCPATKFDEYLSIPASVCPAANNDKNIMRRDTLPVRVCQLNDDGRWIYPSEECLIFAGDWYWYVPPKHDGDIPYAAIISKDTTRTPAAIYPVRVVLFPFVLAGDLVFWPTTYFAYGI
ncbi:MAG TPA: hypothetical protein VGJ73_03915 [Verrucomicrobiae bacterium]|jgi:hypothetical protein